MIKFIFSVLILVVLGLAAVLLVREDPGYMLLRYRGYEVETTLAFGLAVLFALVLVLHYFLKLLRGLLRLPGAMQRQSRNRRFDKSRRLLNQGLIDLAEGRFEQAENNLMRLVDFSESPLLHYLSAARAAQLQGKHAERDNYLKAAHEARPEAEIAIGVTQAELQLAHLQTEQALATLSHLHNIAPRHDYVLMLLARAHYDLEDWAALVELLPDVRRKKLVKEPRLQEMERAGYRGVLELAAASGEQQDFEKSWGKIPKAQQADADTIIIYIELMNQHQWQSNAAGQLVVKSLEQQWDDRLVEVYGCFNVENANAQLERAEKWLDDFGHSEHLLLALGRIAIRAQLWGKAQGYLEASIGARATPAACLALAELLALHLQQQDKAAEYYQRGLKLSLDSHS
jgi:HemY protein